MNGSLMMLIEMNFIDDKDRIYGISAHRRMSVLNISLLMIRTLICAYVYVYYGWIFDDCICVLNTIEYFFADDKDRI